MNYYAFLLELVVYTGDEPRRVAYCLIVLSADAGALERALAVVKIRIADAEVNEEVVKLLCDRYHTVTVSDRLVALIADKLQLQLKSSEVVNF